MDKGIPIKKKIDKMCSINHCQYHRRNYQDCVLRLKADSTGTKHCIGYSKMLRMCVDNCAAPKIDSLIK